MSSLLLVVGLAVSSMAASSPSSGYILKPQFTVKLIITADGALKSIVEGDMTAALDKLDNVDVTAADSASWLLYVNVTPILSSKGIIGYVLSTVIADQYAASTIKGLPAEDFKSPEIAQRVQQQLMKDQVILRDHLVQTCSVQDLKKSYLQIVANFDQTYLMPARENIQDFNLRRSFQ